MGFPPTLWFEEELSGTDGRGAAGIPTGLAGRVERLFEVIEDPKTGETYTNAKVARMSLGELTEEDVEGIRSGSVTDPPLSHVDALARAFGVEPSYLVDGTGEALFDGEIARALSDNTIREITLGCARLPRREKGIVLGIVRQFEAMGANDRTGSALGRPTGRPTLGPDTPPVRLRLGFETIGIHFFVEPLEGRRREHPAGVGVRLALPENGAYLVAARLVPPRPVEPRPALRAEAARVPVAPQLEALPRRREVQAFVSVVGHALLIVPFDIPHSTSL
jgi:hypothetical protein